MSDYDKIKKIFETVGIKNNLAITLDDGSIQIEPELEILPGDFIEYAEQDLLNKDNRSMINALSNAKRAIDCKTDMIMQSLRIPLKKLKMNKFEILHELGILAPRIIEKIRKARNILEHEYKLPSYDIVSDAIDIAILYDAAAQQLFKSFPEMVHLVNLGTKNGTNGHLYSEEIIIYFEDYGYKIRGIKDNNYLDQNIVISINDEMYYLITKVYVTAHMERNQENALYDLFNYLDYNFLS